MKVVLDTNVWISSLLLPRSISGKIISSWKESQFKIITSEPILDEIKEVLSYPKINKRLNMSPAEINEFILFLRFFTEVIQLKQVTFKNTIKLRDMDDSCILLTYFESNADYLITGDKDLLVLKLDYPIINPAEFYDFL